MTVAKILRPKIRHVGATATFCLTAPKIPGRRRRRGARPAVRAEHPRRPSQTSVSFLVFILFFCFNFIFKGSRQRSGIEWFRLLDTSHGEKWNRL